MRHNGICCLLIPIAIVFAHFGLNYSGFCFAETRYLSKEEKIKYTFDRLNNAEKLRIKIPGKGHIYHEHIKYESFDEYIKKNPDCCAINPPGGSDLPPPTFLKRIRGKHSGKFVRIKFNVRYLDANGEQQEQEIISDSPLTNCGKFASFY